MTDAFVKGKGMLSAAIAETLRRHPNIFQHDPLNEEIRRRAREAPKLFEGMNRAQRRALMSNRNKQKD